MTEVNKKFGKRIKDLRKIHGYTQLEMSLKMGISRPSLANIEVGRQKVSIQQVEDFAKFFNTKPYYLMKTIWWNRQPNPKKRTK